MTTAAVVSDILRRTPNAPAVTDEQLEAWRSVPEIVGFLSEILHLDLRGSRRFESQAALGGPLQSLTRLRTLKLFNPFKIPENVGAHVYFSHETSSDSVGQLWESIGSMTALTCLHLNGLAWSGQKRWPKHEAEALRSALCCLTNLMELEMNRNLFCADGATAVAGGLQHLWQLTALNLQVYKVMEYSTTHAEAVAALAKPLIRLTALTSLFPYEGKFVYG